MADSERIRQTLQTIDAPICDDCLGARTNTAPHDVAAVCQQLADHGDVDREQGRCRFCGQAKIVNSPITSANVPG